MQPLLISVETGLFRPTNPLFASFALRQTVIHDKHATIKPFGSRHFHSGSALFRKSLRHRSINRGFSLPRSFSPAHSHHFCTRIPRIRLLRADRFSISRAQPLAQCRADKYSRRQTTQKSVGIQNGEHEVPFPSRKEPSKRRFSPIQSAHQFPSRAAARQLPAKSCRR